MPTGALRGELCALRWDRVNFATGVIDIRSAIAQVNTRVWEKDTKTHQRLGIERREDSFSPDPGAWLNPDTVTQRYSRMCKRLG